jgi:hypothetical protein
MNLNVSRVTSFPKFPNNVLRVELAELQSRPTLFGACTSCPALHEKIAEFRSRIVSLEADLKVPVHTSCSTCELHAVNNLELGQCVYRLKLRMMTCETC